MVFHVEMGDWSGITLETDPSKNFVIMKKTLVPSVQILSLVSGGQIGFVVVGGNIWRRN
jgi:hypothetical protein